MYSDPIAYFVTWTCNGTWLPGDPRGSMRWRKGFLPPRPRLEAWVKDRMTDEAVFLTQLQRDIVEKTVREHVAKRNWHLHTVNCRTNHCHVVVTASDYDPDIVLTQLKSWCKRKLKDDQRYRKSQSIREKWWTRGGSKRLIYDDESLAEVIAYVVEAQDLGGSKYIDGCSH